MRNIQLTMDTLIILNPLVKFGHETSTYVPRKRLSCICFVCECDHGKRFWNEVEIFLSRDGIPLSLTYNEILYGSSVPIKLVNLIIMLGKLFIYNCKFFMIFHCFLWF